MTLLDILLVSLAVIGQFLIAALARDLRLFMAMVLRMQAMPCPALLSDIALLERFAITLGEQNGQVWSTSSGRLVELRRVHVDEGRVVYDCDVVGKVYPPGSRLSGTTVREYCLDLGTLVAPLPGPEAAKS